jgi:hypothetical protein
MDETRTDVDCVEQSAACEHADNHVVNYNDPIQEEQVAVVYELANRMARDEVSGIYSVAFSKPPDGVHRDKQNTRYISVFDSFASTTTSNSSTQSPLVTISIICSSSNLPRLKFDPVKSRLLIGMSIDSMVMWGPLDHADPSKQYGMLYTVFHASFADSIPKFNRAGTRFVSVSRLYNGYAVFDADTGHKLFEHSQFMGTPDFRLLAYAIFSGDDRFLIGFCEGIGLRVVDAENGAIVADSRVELSFLATTFVVPLAASLTDSNLIACAVGQSGIAVLNFMTGQCAMSAETEREPVYSLCFSACGNFLVSGHATSIRCWAVHGTPSSMLSRCLWKTTLTKPPVSYFGYEYEAQYSTAITNLVCNFAGSKPTEEAGDAVASDIMLSSVVCVWCDFVVELDLLTGAELRRALKAEAVDGTVQLYSAPLQTVILM